MNNNTLWNIELFANGEQQIKTRLTSEQIVLVTNLIKQMQGSK